MNGPQWVGVLVLAALVAVVLYPLVIGDRLRRLRIKLRCPHHMYSEPDAGGHPTQARSLLYDNRCIRCGATFTQSP